MDIFLRTRSCPWDHPLSVALMGEVDGMGEEGWVVRGPGSWDFSPVSHIASAISWEILLEGSAHVSGG